MLQWDQWAKLGNIHVVHQFLQNLFPRGEQPAGFLTVPGWNCGSQQPFGRRSAADTDRFMQVLQFSWWAGGEETGRSREEELRCSVGVRPVPGGLWSSRRSALKRGGESLTASSRESGMQEEEEEEEDEEERASHLQSTSRTALTDRVSSLASWASEAAVHRLFL